MALEPEAALTPLGPLKTNRSPETWQDALAQAVQTAERITGLSRGPVSLGSTVRQAEAGHPSCTGTVSPGKGSALPAGPGQPAAGGAQQRGVTPNPAPSTDRKQRGCSGRDQPLRWAKVPAPEGGCEPTAGTGGVGVAGIHLPFGEPQKRKILINLNLICFSSNQL